jgi:hypothetical protein
LDPRDQPPSLLKDFNSNPLTPAAFSIFAETVAYYNKEISLLKTDQSMKEKLPYIISDKFRQIASALRMAIPDLK